MTNAKTSQQKRHQSKNQKEEFHAGTFRRHLKDTSGVNTYLFVGVMAAAFTDTSPPVLRCRMIAGIMS